MPYYRSRSRERRYYREDSRDYYRSREYRRGYSRSPSYYSSRSYSRSISRTPSIERNRDSKYREDYRRDHRKRYYRERRRSPDSRSYSKHKYYSRSNSRDRHSPRGRSRERRYCPSKSNRDYKEVEKEVHKPISKSNTIPLNYGKEISSSLSNPAISSNGEYDNGHKPSSTLPYSPYYNKPAANGHSTYPSVLISPTLSRPPCTAYNGNGQHQGMPPIQQHLIPINGFRPSIVPNFNPYLPFNTTNNPNIAPISPTLQQSNGWQDGTSKEAIGKHNSISQEQIDKISELALQKSLSDKHKSDLEDKFKVVEFKEDIYPHPYHHSQSAEDELDLIRFRIEFDLMVSQIELERLEEVIGINQLD